MKDLKDRLGTEGAAYSGRGAGGRFEEFADGNELKPASTHLGSSTASDSKVESILAGG
ncbi:MAG: hypothetical protein QM757_22815 [Paludibaculum sp.]